MAPGESDIGGLRSLIDSLDDEILALLNRRARAAEEIAEAKRAEGQPSFYVPQREREIIDRLQESAGGPFPVSAIRAVFQEIIGACLSLEQGVRVAYLGPEATFTHQAVRRHFGSAARGKPCGTIAAVFAEVERGEADFGVVPVENSSEGVVHHTLDSFIESPLRIVAEVLVDVSHCLLTASGVAERDIQRVYSHPQALSQCRNWLAANLPRATAVETPSTAEAARAALGDPSGAAIAAELAGRLYGLQVLRRQIQDSADNETRFLVVGQAEPPPPSSAGDDKTSLLLVLPNVSGALYKVLEPLSRAGINLTKIESRPSRTRAWDYVFFLDLDGHATDAQVAPVLAELDAACPLFKILGSYRQADSK